MPRSLHSLGSLDSPQSPLSTADHSGVFAATEHLPSVDQQMRVFADAENTYWQAQFSKETYYAAGRSYDQYRPAYELGWQAAVDYPQTEFRDIAKQLELQWESRRSTSLLPWREVRMAVQEAWIHASQHIQVNKYPFKKVVASASDLARAIRGLYRSCVLLADDLRRMSTVEMGDFAQQVLARHMRLLRKMAHQLKALNADAHADDQIDPLQPLKQRLRGHWQRLTLKLNEWDAAQVFEVCELREQSLIAAYQNSLRKPLPLAVRELLAQHVKSLKNNMEKLSWVRHNWVL